MTEPATPENSSGKRFQDLPDAEKARLAKEQCLKDHPGLTSEEYDEMAKAFGF